MSKSEDNNQQDAPKVFISYAWAKDKPEHDQWVMQLATELRDSFVDVILDKWDLKEGHDAVAFMEKMVTDETIKKVIMISDKTYAEKADGRQGGVGTETQIISKKVYEEQNQGKFVAVLPEKDENGKAYLPTYYSSRIYIDLSQSEKYAEEFEKLLRWIFEKPLNEKPPLGKKPEFLSEKPLIFLGTTVKLRRVEDALKNSKSYVSGALSDYLSTFYENLEQFRITENEGHFDDAVISSIESFTPYKNELLHLVLLICQFSPTEEIVQKLHRFFEQLIPYLYRPAHIHHYKETDFDNFRFIIHELFLSTLAIFIKEECFEQANSLLEQRYFFSDNSGRGRNEMVNFISFYKSLNSLENRNNRLKLNRASLRADLLKQRSENSEVKFHHLMQADFILYMRSEIVNENHYRWWPETLVYAGRSYDVAFEVFARSISRNYFEKVKALLGIQTLQELEKVLSEFQEGKRQSPKWDFNWVNPAGLMGFDRFARLP